MGKWRQAVVAALVVASAPAGCSALREPPKTWDSQAACQTANPGQRCGYSTCDVNCPINQGSSGWGPIAAPEDRK